MITGPLLVGVSSRLSLEKALDLAGYQQLREKQELARKEGRLFGIGFATFIEAAPGPENYRQAIKPVASEVARVKLEADGHLVVYAAQAPQGQSHQTTLAQVAADAFGVPFDHVRVVTGDTDSTPYKFIGTAGSLASTWASGSVILSARKVREKVLAIASELLEISPDDLNIEDGVISPYGLPSKAIPLAQIAFQAIASPDSLPPGTDHRLEAEERFTGEGITGSGWSGGTHLCTVEVDPETGQVTILRYLVTEDCGRVINPAIVEGQVRGGTAQGIGEVLYERAAYDEEGNFLTATFMDYLLPTAAEIPSIEVHHMETDPEGEFGFRGVGEGGAIVAPAALTNAIADAIAPTGGRVHEQYLSPCKILQLMGVIETAE